MDIDVSKIKDPGLATAVWNLGRAVDRKVNKPRWQPAPRQSHDRDERYYRHSRDEAVAAAREAARRQGEKPGDA